MNFFAKKLLPSSRFFLSSLRIRLLLLVFIAVIPAISLILYTAEDRRKAARAEVMKDTHQLARLTANSLKKMVEESYQLHLSLSYLPCVRNKDSASCSGLFAELKKHLPMYSSISAFEPDGDLYCSSAPVSKKINSASLLWFQRTIQARRFFFGDYRICNITDKQVIVSSYPVIDKNGKILSVLNISIDLPYLNALLGNIYMEEGTSLIVINRNGTVLSHYPEPEKWTGSLAADKALVRTILSKHEGMSEIRCIDDVKRIVSFMPVEGTDRNIYAGIGISTDIAFAKIDRDLVINLLLLGLITIFAGLAAWVGGEIFIMRRVNNLINTTKRFAGGDLKARADVSYREDEIGQLNSSFNKMADAIEYHMNEHKQARDILKKEKEKARKYLDIAGVMIVVIDSGQKVALINKKGCKILEHKEEDIIGKNWFDNFIPERGRTELKEVFNKLMSGSGAFFEYYENPVLTKTGQERVIAWHNALLGDESGSITGTLSSGEDITERVRAEEALRRQHHIVMHVMETSPVGITVLNRSGQITFANTRAEEVLGLTKKEIASRTYNAPEWRFTDFNGNPLPENELPFSRVMETIQPAYDVRHAIEWQDGRRVLLSINAAPVFDETGSFDGIIATVSDITQQVRSEEKIIRLNRLYSVLSKTNEAIVRIRDRRELYGRICRIAVEEGLFLMAWVGVIEPDTLSIKPAACCGCEEAYLDNIMLSIDENVPEGKGPTGIAIREGKYFICNDIENNAFMFPWRGEALKRGYRSSAAFALKTRDRLIGAISFYAGESFYFKEEEIRLLQSLSEDISFALELIEAEEKNRQAEEEKARLEEQLRHAQKMEAIGQLAGGIAHDFNNILTAIIGFGRLLSIKIKHDYLLMSYIEQILDSAETASNLTRQLLAFSRKQIINAAPVNLNDIVKNLEKLLKRLISEDIELKIDLDDKDLVIVADSSQIEQVLINLATNARDAMLDGGLLTISTELVDMDAGYVSAHGYGSPGRYALLTIADTGEGMDDITRERIFEPFFTTKETGRGTGIGLAVVYGIIKQHKGYINVYSEPDKGTTFKIYFPVTELEPAGRESLDLSFPSGGTETILIAEDNISVRELLKKILGEFGYEIIEAEDGEDAVIKFMENKDNVQLVIFDVIMPKKTGKEAYDEIRKIRPDIKAIFLSGYTAEVIDRKGILEEGLNFISKPFPPNELLRRVRDVLDR